MSSPTVTNTSAQLNGVQLTYAKSVTLTNAQVKALPTTPVTLLAAPGTDLRIKIFAGTARWSNTGAYTNIDPSFCIMSIQNAATDWLAGPVAMNHNGLATPLTTVTDSFGTIADGIFDFLGGTVTPIDQGATSGAQEKFVPTSAVATTNVNNGVVQIAVDNNGAGVWTGGNALNFLTITLYYALEAL